MDCRITRNILYAFAIQWHVTAIMVGRSPFPSALTIRLRDFRRGQVDESLFLFLRAIYIGFIRIVASSSTEYWASPSLYASSVFRFWWNVCRTSTVAMRKHMQFCVRYFRDVYDILWWKTTLDRANLTLSSNVIVIYYAFFVYTRRKFFNSDYSLLAWHYSI